MLSIKLTIFPALETNDQLVTSKMTPLGSINFNLSCVRHYENFLCPCSWSLKYLKELVLTQNFWVKIASVTTHCSIVQFVVCHLNEILMELFPLSSPSCFIIVIISMQWDQKINKNWEMLLSFPSSTQSSVLQSDSHCRTVVKWKANQSVPFVYVSIAVHGFYQDNE